MWAAANSRKRSRTDAAGNILSESEDSDTSSDGERSTTESIHENNNNNAILFFIVINIMQVQVKDGKGVNILTIEATPNTQKYSVHFFC